MSGWCTSFDASFEEEGVEVGMRDPDRDRFLVKTVPLTAFPEDEGRECMSLSWPTGTPAAAITAFAFSLPSEIASFDSAVPLGSPSLCVAS